MSLLKYFGEQGGQHKGNLKWLPASEGLPPLRGFNGNAVTKTELDDIEIEFDFHHREFNLRNPEDSRAYDDVRERGINGWYEILHIDRSRFPAEGLIYLEWRQLYGVIPKPKTPPRHGEPIEYILH